MSLPAKARQWFYPERNSYNDLVLAEIPLPAVKSHEVLVKTHAVSLQYRDLLVAKASYPGVVQPNLVPCSDMAGEIIAVGAEVKNWKVGDRVSANFILDKLHDEMTAEIAATGLGGSQQGVLTEYRTFPAHSLVAIPAPLSYEEAATLPSFSPLKAGDTILVLGTGGVSIFALQFAIASGATVIALSSSDEKLKAVKKLGAKHVINYKTMPQWDEEVMKLTNGVGVDRVVEVSGNTTLERSIASVKFNGSIDLIGHLSGGGPPVDVILPAIRKGLKFRGVFKDMNRLIEANVAITRPVIDKIFPFEQAKDAYAYLESQAHVGKVVINIS
ncbi:Alcohol dehydrogenase superfamily protein [Mycena venus]|uniref:Alcohol dehydrogenase superfamily protein n=1 Tax=Mycena venus TaxID=2733690 RepID=A0A8H6YL68_9AGAR|nr:Alcohol dehydrogenase superfamily protein [Mycena venus]